MLLRNGLGDFEALETIQFIQVEQIFILTTVYEWILDVSKGIGGIWL